MATATGKQDAPERTPPYVLVTAGGVVGRIALADESLKQAATELLRDLAVCDVPAAQFAAVADWRGPYEQNALETWAVAVASLESLYQQIHKLRISLSKFVGDDWIRTVRESSSYSWYASKSDVRPSDRSEAARELAWLDYVCRMRNQAVQHRVERGSELVGYTVAEAFSATYIDPRKVGDLTDVRRLYEETRRDYPVVTQEATGEVADVAYLLSLAEQLHDLDPDRVDEMRRAIIRSRVPVLVGSGPWSSTSILRYRGSSKRAFAPSFIGPGEHHRKDAAPVGSASALNGSADSAPSAPRRASAGSRSSGHRSPTSSRRP